MAEVCALLSVIQIVDDITVVTACASMTVTRGALFSENELCCAGTEK